MQPTVLRNDPQGIARRIENAFRINDLVSLVKNHRVAFAITHPAWGFDPKERNLTREGFFMNAAVLLGSLQENQVLFLHGKEEERALAEAKFRTLGTDITKFHYVISGSGHLLGHCVDGGREKASRMLEGADIVLQGGFYRGQCTLDTRRDLEEIAEQGGKSIFVVANRLVCKSFSETIPSISKRIQYRITVDDAEADGC